MRPTALGTYIYGGGFYFGAKNHVDVLAHMEDPKPIINTKVFQYNVPSVPIRYGNWDEYLMTVKNKVDIAFANPPCAIVSPIGRSNRHGKDSYKTDPRVQCWMNSAVNGLKVNAKVVIIETVPQILTKAKEMLEEYAWFFSENGYDTTLFLHSTRWMGSAQDRNRVFFIAHRGVEWTPDDTYHWDESFVTNSALSIVEDKQPTAHKFPEKWIPLYHKMKRRANGKWEGLRATAMREGTDGPMPMFMLGRLSREHHMGAFCGNYYLHPEEPRFLSMPEMRSLCGYPTSYRFEPQHLKMCQTVFAQAVMPAAGDYIMRATSKVLNEAKESWVKRNTVLLYDWREKKNEPTIFIN